MADLSKNSEKANPAQDEPVISDADRIQATEGIVRIISGTGEAVDEPPDGGLVAWLQVIPAMASNIIAWGYGSGYAVFQLYYKEKMNLPASQVSWVGSVQLFLYFLVGMISGRLVDAGYTRYLYVSGALLVVFGMFMTSLATEYWHILLAQGLCNGIGGGCMYMPAVINVGTYFRRKRTLAMSIPACGSSVGAILFPAIVQYLTPHIGFPWVVRVCGFIAVFLSAAGIALLRPRKLRRRPAPILDLGAFRVVPFAAFAGGSFLIYIALLTMLLYINSFARETIGLTQIESINFVLVSHAVAIPARPIFGFVADHYLGPVNTYGMSALSLGILAFGWVGVATRRDMYGFSIVMGFVNGAAQGVFPGATSSLVKDISKLGTWVGMIFALCGIATLIGPPIMGAIVDASGGKYVWGQVWAGLVIVSGAMLVLSAVWLAGARGSGRLSTKA